MPSNDVWIEEILFTDSDIQLLGGYHFENYLNDFVFECFEYHVRNNKMEVKLSSACRIT